MTVDLLIHAIVRQTTILIAHLATSRGQRSPLASVANQVFLDLVGELERQRVSRKVSADMFGLGLRTYRRKIQRLNESATDRGRSLWEVVLEYLREHGSAKRVDLLTRFSVGDDAPVKAVLRDLCESQLVVATGRGASTTYRAVVGEELLTRQKGRGAEGLDELVLALLFREAPLSVEEIAHRARLEPERVEPILTRLAAEGRVERTERDGLARYQTRRLIVPLGATAGWEAAVFDHFKALVATIMCRLREESASPDLADTVGGSTYTVTVWPGHPMADEVLGTLKRIRTELSGMRDRVAKANRETAVPEEHTRVVIYVGQCLIGEGNEPEDPHP
jgi:DNA-binding Lrp family transcriptional regulator